MKRTLYIEEKDICVLLSDLVQQIPGTPSSRSGTPPNILFYFWIFSKSSLTTLLITSIYFLVVFYDVKTCEKMTESTSDAIPWKSSKSSFDQDLSDVKISYTGQPVLSATPGPIPVTLEAVSDASGGFSNPIYGKTPIDVRLLEKHYFLFPNYQTSIQ